MSFVAAPGDSQRVQAATVLLANPASSIEDYRAGGGYAALERALTAGNPELVVAEVEASGLRGRGGAAFPTARKWRAALANPAPRYLVCNGGEDEPGSLKDRRLMEQHPHTLVEGLLLAGYAVGAERAFLYINVTFSGPLAAVRAAVDDARAAGYVGRESRTGVEVEVVEAPAEYVAGEESAALEVIEGKKALPRRKPPYPTDSGLWGRPTVINNVETLAALPSIVRDGAAVYRQLGTAESPGTLLITLTGWIEKPGVYEIPFGTPLRAIVEDLGGGVRGGKRLRAISPGGPSTAYLTAASLDTPYEYGALREAGSSIGCGTIRVVPEGACMVEELSRFAPFFAEGSCGQCGPCVQGTRKLATVTEEIRLGTLDRRPLDLLARLGVRLRGMGICGLITGATFPAASAIELFPEDFEHHARYGICPGLGQPARQVAHRHAWTAPGAGPIGLRRPHVGGIRRSRWA